MSKNYEATKLYGIQINIQIPIDKQNASDVTEYYAASLDVSGMAKSNSGDMTVPAKTPTQYLGAAKTVPWTPHEVWQAIQGAPLNTIFANALKDLYQQWLDEDITT